MTWRSTVTVTSTPDGRGRMKPLASSDVSGEVTAVQNLIATPPSRHRGCVTPARRARHGSGDREGNRGYPSHGRWSPSRGRARCSLPASAHAASPIRLAPGESRRDRRARAAFRQRPCGVAVGGSATLVLLLYVETLAADEAARAAQGSCWKKQASRLRSRPAHRRLRGKSILRARCGRRRRGGRDAARQTRAGDLAFAPVDRVGPAPGSKDRGGAEPVSFGS